MLADRLIEPAAAQLAAGVLTVLSGQDLDSAANTHGLPVEDLSEALQTYQAAGYAALEHRVDQQWHQVFVEFPDWQLAEQFAATQLGPLLDELCRRGVIGGWWFLRKHPCWRLRLRSTAAGSDFTAVAEVLSGLTDAGTLTAWRPSVYEPELAAFGGPASVAIIHDLFSTDTHGVLNYARQHTPRIGRRELSVMLLHTLFQAAELDWFECGDVFHRVAQLRPAPPNAAPPTALETLADNVRDLVRAADHPDDPMFGPSGPAAFAAGWRDALQHSGRRFHSAADQGHLDRGLRAVLAHVVIFHWNRLGLSATAQGALAHAAIAAFLPHT